MEQTINIVHIAPNAPYNENWGYQENILPRYQRMLGHNVSIIITNTENSDHGIVETDCCDKMLDDGVRLIRLPVKMYPSRIITKLAARLNVIPFLNEIDPDLIFFHGLVSATIFDVIRYKRRREKAGKRCILVQDNHLDNNIGAVGGTKLRACVIRFYYRLLNKASIKYIDRVYGVTPWRKNYARDYFHIPEEKLDLLIMGADDTKLDFPMRKSIRERIRRKNGIRDDEFLLVTGGKLDKKKKTDVLIKACANQPRIKLLIFGSVSDEDREDFDSLLSSAENIIYIGWIPADEVYDYFFAADLVCFPGQHSVLWEQACASKTPCLIAKWPGMDHVNAGGNADLFTFTDPYKVREKILSLVWTDDYKAMRMAAESNITDCFLYSAIAKKTIDDYFVLLEKQTDK